MNNSTAKPVWAPFHIPRRDLNWKVEKDCLMNCACPRCDGLLRGRLFFITHWSREKYDAKTLGKTYEDRLSTWLRPRFWRIGRKPRASVIGCRSMFSDHFSRTDVYVYSSLVLLPQDVEWKDPWIKMLISRDKGPHYTFEGDGSFGEWAAVSSCPMGPNDPSAYPGPFYWAALHQLYPPGGINSKEESGLEQAAYGDISKFRERMISTFPNLDKAFFCSRPDKDELSRFTQDHLHAQWIPGKGKHSHCSLQCP